VGAVGFAIVLILLPPSEGKTPGRGRPLDLANLSLPELTMARSRVLDTLVTRCREDPLGAATMLGLGPTQADEVAVNVALRTAPTRAAVGLYTGVLYDALDFETLGTGAKSLLRRTTMIFSGLWGAVRLGDRIPAYRLSVGVNLPGPGRLGSYWRAEMSTAMDTYVGGGLVIDLRSAAYAPMWAPTNVATVRVRHERTVAGVTTRSVVSHFNKATKGRIVRDLACAGARPKTVGQLVSALRDLKYTVESTDRPGQLDVVVAEL
jgi:uncharacterized protein